MDEKSKERREYFRIDDKAIVSAKKITSSDNTSQNDPSNAAFLLGSAIASLDIDNQTLHSKIKRNSTELALYLDIINQKINLISQHILEHNAETFNQAPQLINISASGIAFDTYESLETNDLVQVKLILLPEKTGILCTGKVIRVTQNENSSTLYIDFTNITESDQEIIIKHNLALQLEDARKKNQ